MEQNHPLLQVKHLKTYFQTENGDVPAVDDISFEVGKGETLAVVGESGSGKSVTALSILKLIGKKGKIKPESSIEFEGKELTQLTNNQMREIRGNDIAMIFQEPLSSLNPVFTVGNQISEAILLHQDVSKAEAKQMSIDMLQRVGIARAEKVYDSYPHSLSGGMRQRVMIAIGLSCNPKLLIADEPTTALDVTIQAQILKLMKELIKERDTSIILITHDLGVVAEMVDRVAVMYAGQIVEQSDVYSLFENPKHPYTEGLLNSTPNLDNKNEELKSIKGVVPNPLNMPKGCRFHPRCPHAMRLCVEQAPPLREVEYGHQVGCWLHIDDEEEDVNAAVSGKSV
jgi:oligopeptide/dipeptide ABC transporter ATP-binding protein